MLIVDTKSDLNVYCSGDQEEGGSNGCCGESKSSAAQEDNGAASTARDASSGIDYNDCAGSFKIYAVKK